MVTKIEDATEAALGKRGYPDLHEHIDALRASGLLIEVEREINKNRI